MVTFFDFNPNQDGHPLITPREYEVLRLIAQGRSTHQMAIEMKISFHTVETYRKHLIEKFDSRNTAELIKKASKFFWL